MSSKTLSIIPYYGGKARMSSLIASLLDYDDSDIYVEPFGGGCRTLLNKPRHKEEVYNDYGDGIVALMRVMSDSELSRELIYRLYETEYSQEEFNSAKKIYDICNTDFDEYSRDSLAEELKGLLVEYKIMQATDKLKAFHSILDESEKAGNEKIINELLVKIKDEKKEKIALLVEKVKYLFDSYAVIKDLKQEQGLIERTRDRLDVNISDMDLAEATYIVIEQSMDAMGKVWSSAKFKSTAQYRKKLLKLFDAAERMENVIIYQIDAMDFFKHYFDSDMQKKELSESNNCDDIKYRDSLMNKWITNPRVMIYADPSYISPDIECGLLEDIEWEDEENLSRAIKLRREALLNEIDVINKKINKLEVENKKKEIKKLKKEIVIAKKKLRNKGFDNANLGKVYPMSFEYENHESFLRCICDAKCKILVSNYDLLLYKKYLSEDRGWRRLEFATTTGVGSKENNERIEVLWYNY
ncbi:DNA adenine methylase [Clostridium sp.]|uniref:DNA adenine methylase n=1 Tax=Clostridium sp. TaxID=1506 RepID=UPI003D6CC58B